MTSSRAIDWKSLYDRLQLKPGASQSELKSRFRALSNLYHPDGQRERDEEAFKLINEAYELLMRHENAQARDTWLAEYQRSQLPPRLRFDPPRITLGRVCIGETKRATLRIRNDGGIASETTYVTREPDADWVEHDAARGDGLDDFLHVEVMCRPHAGVALGPWTFSVAVSSGSASAKAEITLQVTEEQRRGPTATGTPSKATASSSPSSPMGAAVVSSTATSVGRSSSSSSAGARDFLVGLLWGYLPPLGAGAAYLLRGYLKTGRFPSDWDVAIVAPLPGLNWLLILDALRPKNHADAMPSVLMSFAICVALGLLLRLYRPP